ncbi:MAG TPA: hypothetical protein VGA84_04485 [Thermoanaerobaculia bacterium]
MRRVVFAALLLLVCPIAVAQHFHHLLQSAPEDDLRGSPCTKTFLPAKLNAGLQKVNWPVSASTDDALKFFSQGMTQYYGFNYEEALRNFRAAAKANGGEMAMASWGIALASGPNINLGMDNDCRTLAITQSRKALELAMKQEDGKQVCMIRPQECALIKALILRYNNAADPASETIAFSAAMGDIWNSPPDTKSYTNIPDVGALYAESMLELRPWALFTKDHKPVDPELNRRIYQALETSIEAERNAVGANHFWIHTVEASATPGDALPSANLLDTRAPLSGHLVHMPSHIYLLLGDYKAALESNLRAAGVDREEYAGPCRGTFLRYKLDPLCPQLYYGHYLSHNLFFGAVSATFLGQRKQALKLAHETRTHVEHFVANEPGLQRYMTAELMTRVMNNDWSAILDEKVEPEPPAKCYLQAPFTKPDGCHILRSIWHWARGMAYATHGDVTSANKEADAMDAQMREIVEPTPIYWGNNLASTVLAIARPMLQARILWARNDQKNAIEQLKIAVVNEGKLTYDEPPQWFAPAREALGGAYLQTRQFGPAEATFKEELLLYPKSGRALYGLMRALEGKGEPDEEVEKEFATAWRNADYTMTNKDLWPAIRQQR